MPRCTARFALAMLAVACVVVAWAAGKGTTMANNSKGNSKGTTTTTTALATTATALATTPVALAPHVHAAPTLPSTQPAANWQLVGQPSTAKAATNGVGPAPAQGTVGYAALAAIAAGGSQGCTLAAMQAAITAVGRKGKHPAMPLLTWLAKHRGYSFACTNGMVTLHGQGQGQGSGKA